MKIFLVAGLIAVVMGLSACKGPGPGGPGPGGLGPGGLGGDDQMGPPPFSGLDSNGDGKLTLEEFKKHEIPHGEHAEVFRSIDSDGDGVVTETELASHRPPPPPPR